MVRLGGAALADGFVHHYAGGYRDVERAYVAEHRDGYQLVAEAVS